MFEFLWSALAVTVSIIAALQLAVAAPLIVKKMGPLGLIFLIGSGFELYRGFNAAMRFDIWALAIPILIGMAAMSTRHWMTR